MAKTKKQEAAIPVTRAEKKDATKNLIKEILSKKSYKHNDLIENAAKLYVEKFSGEETENVNDVKGRVGSVLDIMKKEGDVAYDGGMYALNASQTAPVTETASKEKKAPKAKKKTAEKSDNKEKERVVEQQPIAEKEIVATEKTEEKSAPKANKKTAKKAEEQSVTESKEKKVKAPRAKTKKQVDVTPVETEAQQPIVEQEVASAEKEVEQPTIEKTEEKPAPKAKKKTAKKAVEKPAEKTPEKTEEKSAETPAEKPHTELVVKEKAEVVKKEVVDMSFLFGGIKTPAAGQGIAPTEKTTVKPIEKQPTVGQGITPAEKSEEKPEQKPEQKTDNKRINVRKLAQDAVKKLPAKAPQKPMTADERLREAFLRRLRQLGGEYFEYYSVYLLERYSMKNGRRLEGMRISGGGRDGGIDGEIELTDRFGFKETIYIQSKNWDPSKGDERLWVVGETLLQQFIGACVCRQAKDGKQNARGIFVTTSKFTPDAKRILEDMSDKIIGYDGEDVYEAAKDCQFGLLYENGNWKLDEKLLSGEKAFFNML